MSNDPSREANAGPHQIPFSLGGTEIIRKGVREVDGILAERNHISRCVMVRAHILLNYRDMTVTLLKRPWQRSRWPFTPEGGHLEAAQAVKPRR